MTHWEEAFHASQKTLQDVRVQLNDEIHRLREENIKLHKDNSLVREWLRVAYAAQIRASLAGDEL